MSFVNFTRTSALCSLPKVEKITRHKCSPGNFLRILGGVAGVGELVQIVGHQRNKGKRKEKKLPIIEKEREKIKHITSIKPFTSSPATE